MTPHIIRLRDPWQWAPAAGTENIWASRWFNRPTGLEPNTRVVLVVASLAALRGVWLNDQKLVGHQPPDAVFECEISKRLELRNQLQLEFNASETDDAVARLRASLAEGNVRLEIYE